MASTALSPMPPPGSGELSGEHRYRASTSRDGTHWTWYGTRVLPAGPQPRIGLGAFEAAEPLTATFDYVRFHRP
ncbi:hypothetical protein [Nonomuraea insulae]|uniref:Beta-xylosidase C-terminal Concanavalin A-like domain-containing protein n=1 Tax=Nonomuraea insulae TaxID=1616787 RepID=A0ABW1CH39_9ACTN